MQNTDLYLARRRGLDHLAPARQFVERYAVAFYRGEHRRNLLDTPGETRGHLRQRDRVQRRHLGHAHYLAASVERVGLGTKRDRSTIFLLALLEERRELGALP